ncbi:ABC transporter permease [Dactylosporangium sp. CA-233914]|uniref:ABC transporter permease n=1 Tax=Dactylosporangium sp. CA-233914 TaxID=3239934 RepID=UPI003D8E2144
MSTNAAPLADSAIMLRRNFKHIARNPTAVFNGILFPVVIMLMFVYMLGDAFNVGVDYVDYATPGMVILAITYGLSATAMGVNADMTKGVINRFKVMDVSRGAILTAHVVASMLTSLIAILAIIGMAFVLGFRPSASFLDWLGVAGVVVLVGFAAGWFTVALGLAAKTPESAGMSTVALVMLPFLSSAIVPAEKMGPGVREFAEYQPFTSINETLRGLLAGEPSASDAITAIAWCVGIAVVGYVWAIATFKKRA